MQAKDVMTRQVIGIAPDASIFEALRLMIEHKISGLPVIDKTGNLAGIVSEGDFLRRAETDTERKRSRWRRFLAGPGQLAGDYVRTHGRRVDEVMTADVITVKEDATLEEVVALIEKHRVKRLPVVRGGELVGIVTRANLLRALVGAAWVAGTAGENPPASNDDEAIRSRVIAEIGRQTWAPGHLIDVVVHDGAVELWGTVFDARQRDAAWVAAENVSGVKAVKSHISCIDPMSGMVVYDPDDEVDDASAPAVSSSPVADQRHDVNR